MRAPAYRAFDSIVSRKRPASNIAHDSRAVSRLSTAARTAERRGLTPGAASLFHGLHAASDLFACRRRTVSPRRALGHGVPRRTLRRHLRAARLRRCADRWRSPVELCRVGAAERARRPRLARPRRRTGRRGGLPTPQLVGGRRRLPGRRAHRGGGESGAADLPRPRAALRARPVRRRRARHPGRVPRVRLPAARRQPARRPAAPA